MPVTPRLGAQSVTVDDIVHERALLVAIAFRLVGNREDAEDIVSDATTSMLERMWHGFDVDPIGPYLRTAVRNRSIDLLRQRATRRTYAVDALEFPCVLGGDMGEEPGEERLELEERAELVRAALAALPSRQRVVLLRHFGAGMPPRGVAQELGISGPAARQLLKRSKLAFKRAVTAELLRHGGAQCARYAGVTTPAARRHQQRCEHCSAVLAGHSGGRWVLGVVPLLLAASGFEFAHRLADELNVVGSALAQLS